MNAKIYAIIAFALMATALFATASVLAEDAVVSGETSTTNAITSEVSDNLSESVSGLKIGWENMRLWFTFNNEKKAIQELKIARLRLIQAKVAAQTGDTDAMQKALEAHDKLIDRVKQRVDAIDGEATKEGIRNSAEKLVGLERAIEVHDARISKLNEILASANLTDEQRAKLEEKIAKAENNTAQLKELEAAKEDKIKTRLRAVGSMTETEADSVMLDMKNAQNLFEVRKAVAEAKLEHKASVIESVKERLRERANKPAL